ncbi:MAG TPA: sensor domain-containing diguanylate cyclase [Pyrinomonadaceae bacterium]|nr:sensor domain-containing diguanylate cyclase [Pyrinomonadaceae bacterium]
MQLHRYFEDVVLENNLAALVVESLPPERQRPMRDIARVRDVGRSARFAFFIVSPEDALNEAALYEDDPDRGPILMRRSSEVGAGERFVIIADARFSALLVAVQEEDGSESAGDEVVWSFEPDVVYSALEYLMARATAELPGHAHLFSKAVRSCVPKATSLQLTVSVTTKLARLLQEQAVREIAVNRISTAIRSSLELPSVFQTTVNEVGRALGAQQSALSVEGEHEQPPLTTFYVRGGEADEATSSQMLSDLEAYGARLRGRIKSYVHDGTSGAGESDTRPVAVVPIIYHDRTLGVLMVASDDPERVWQDSEVMLLRTVADQVAVAVNHGRLYQQMQRQALTDSLTSCFNRRFFEIQLERDLHLATRMRQPVSLIFLDIDKFKTVNDTHGHAAGDAALRMIANVMREELRGVDTAARYGGEEFAIILPQAGPDGALVVAERLRARVEATEFPCVGHITASFGVATFPLHASSRELLVTTADRALYQAKRTGRNRVCSPADLPLEEMPALPFEADAPALEEAHAAAETTGGARETAGQPSAEETLQSSGEEPVHSSDCIP